ncbi:MAG: hypothetical protein WAO28_03845 [Candidatus Microsaccharimonas sp.]
MTNPTDTDTQDAERRDREPALRDTRIEIRDDVVRQQLMAKLAEYKNRWAEDAELTPTERVEKGGRGVLPLLFKESILETVLALQGDEARDFTAQPIVITEVALAVQEATGRRIISAATVPFTFNQDALTYSPDFGRMWDVDPEVSSFLNAYMVIKTYATGSNFSVEGGTGVPVLPLEPPKSTYLGWD